MNITTQTRFGSVSISFSSPDSAPRADFNAFPKGREKTHSFQSGTNRIIQEMAAVCTKRAKITLLLKTQWTQQCVLPLQKLWLSKRQKGREREIRRFPLLP